MLLFLHFERLCVKVEWGHAGLWQEVGHCVFVCAEVGDKETGC